MSQYELVQVTKPHAKPPSQSWGPNRHANSGDPTTGRSSTEHVRRPDKPKDTSAERQSQGQSRTAASTTTASVAARQMAAVAQHGPHTQRREDAGREYLRPGSDQDQAKRQQWITDEKQVRPDVQPDGSTKQRTTETIEGERQASSERQQAITERRNTSTARPHKPTAGDQRSKRNQKTLEHAKFMSPSNMMRKRRKWRRPQAVWKMYNTYRRARKSKSKSPTESASKPKSKATKVKIQNWKQGKLK